MDSKDKKETVQLVGGLIDKKITPRLAKIEKQNEGIIEQVAKNSEDIEMVKEDVDIVKDDIKDMGYTIERIETRIDTAFRREDNLALKTDQLSRRVLRLESKKTS